MRPLPLWPSLLAVCLAITSICAQLPADPPASPKMDLGQIPSRLAELDREFEEKLLAMRKEVDAQTAEKKISEVLAASLRWSLSASAFSASGFNSKDIIATLRIPPDNPKLAAAATALEETFNHNQRQRVTLLAEAAEEIRRRYEVALAEAPTADAVVAVRREIEAGSLAQDAFEVRPQEYFDAVRDARSILSALEGTLRAIEDGKQEAIPGALFSFRNSLGLAWNGRGASVAGQARLERIAKPFKDGLAAAENDLLDAFAAGRAEAELKAGLDRLSEAEKFAWAVAPNSSSRRDARSAAYRAILGVLVLAKSGDAQRVRDAMQVAKSAVHSDLGELPSAKLLALLERVERDAVGTLAIAREAKAAQFRSRLLALKTPSELEALAAEIRAAFSRQEGQDLENWNALAAELMTLAARWAGADTAGHESRSGYQGRLAVELSELRQKIERDVMGRRMRLPELNAAPLAGLPLAEALEALCDQLAEKKEWRRLYDLLTLRPATQQQRAGADGRDDTVGALRSFFAGQNFELAEQWPQAAAAYLAVLQSVSPRAPITEAAGRLKEIKSKHPDAVPKPGEIDPRLRRNF